MEKHINIVLPDKVIDVLEYKHSFMVSRVGYYEEPRNHYIVRDNLDDAVLLLCLDGSGYVEYKEKSYEIHRGDVALLEPLTPHRYGANDDDRWTILWAHFRGGGIEGLISLYKKFGMNYVFHLDNFKGAAEELKNIISMLSDNYNSINIHKACCILQMVLLGFIDTYSNKNTKDNRYTEEAVSFMKSNLYNNIDLMSLSQHLGISTFHTIRIFKASFMSTPMQYYNMMRINEAGQLLLSSKITVAEISRDLNYSSQFYFSQQFKKKMGVSPIAYKKLMSSKY